MKVIRHGNQVSIMQADHVGDELPVSNYSICYADMKGYYLTRKENFILPSKIYGHTEEFANRVIKTYNSLGKGMGVLLSGFKGTGKTVEAKQICVNSNKPVLILNTAYIGGGFSEFLDSIETPSIIFIDEFEKVYSQEEARNFFLTLMDGTARSRHLYLLTSNNSQIGEYFHSRPGRIRYHKSYDFLDDVLISEIVEDKLNNKDLKPKVIAVLNKISQLSIDSVTAILDECNIHNESPDQFMDIFNVNSTRPTNWNVVLECDYAQLKADISQEEIYDAEDSQSYYNNHFGKNINFDKYCIIKKTKFERSHLSNLLRGKDRPNIIAESCREIDVDYSKAKTKHISWEFSSLKSFSETREGVVAIHKSGAKLIATPAKEFSQANWD